MSAKTPQSAAEWTACAKEMEHRSDEEWDQGHYVESGVYNASAQAARVRAYKMTEAAA